MWKTSWPLALVLCLFHFYAIAQTTLAPVCTARSDDSLLTFDLEPVLTGLRQPISVTHAGDGSGRLFVTEKEGRVRVVRDGRLQAAPFLDLSDQVVTTGEQGLLSLAFHPDYARNGRFFVFYTVHNGDNQALSVLAEHQVSRTDPDIAVSRGRTILTLPQTRLPIHKAGQLQFGPDGYLYISLGDGDIPDEAQNLGSLYGSLLRLDVDTAGVPYAIPADNPFVDKEGARDEIWAYGFRNPWRFSIDPCTGDLFVGDVGSSRYEEVDLVTPGENYGWPTAEAMACDSTFLGLGCTFTQPKAPIHWYGHLNLDEEGGNSVIGGYVYHGHHYPQLRGRYLFTDFASRRLWVLTKKDQEGPGNPFDEWQREVIGEANEPLSSFGVDQTGEVYALGFVSGTLYRLDREELDPTESDLSVTQHPKTIALDNFSALQEGKRDYRWGLGSRSSLEFYLNQADRIALYFEVLSPLAKTDLTIVLNGQPVASYPQLEQRPQSDWLLMTGRPGRNQLVFKYRDASSTHDADLKRPALRFLELQLETVRGQ